jgi:hypothetical protein
LRDFVAVVIKGGMETGVFPQGTSTLAANVYWHALISNLHEQFGHEAKVAGDDQEAIVEEIVSYCMYGLLGKNRG